MTSINLKNGSEITLQSIDGEIINVRVYSDGWVKFGSLNMREDFETIAQAENFIFINGLVEIQAAA